MDKGYPVIDLFAGPGGLGEGFATSEDGSGRRRFVGALAVEKEPHAFQTLLLRHFLREFPDISAVPQYQDYLRSEGEMSREQLFAEYPQKASKARACVMQATLGEDTEKVKENIRKQLKKKLNESKAWVLVGGPPCQAYSLIGRSRMSANQGFEQDARFFLYQEYLRIIAEHEPPVFLMENVRGLLSARTSKSGSMIKRIINGLCKPAQALGGCDSLQYKLYSLTEGREYSEDEGPEQFLVQSEKYGIPQRRHRVFIVGIRSDLHPASLGGLETGEALTVQETIGDLPRLRSGLSRQDSFQYWEQALETEAPKYFSPAMGREWKKELSSGSLPAERQAGRFSEQKLSNHPILKEIISRKAEVLTGHETRGHMESDLHRYLFCSLFAKMKSRSPTLSDFPAALLPCHANVFAGQRDNAFSDRFRVQVEDQPATTITAHIAKDGHYFIHYDPLQCRSLTVREAARLQTFPDDYKFEGPRTSQYQQVGNAVPPALARRIAGRIADLLDSIED